jgi:hypothetical protein
MDWKQSDPRPPFHSRVPPSNRPADSAAGAGTALPGEHDDAIRKEVIATLKLNPAVTYDTVLGSWRYGRHGSVAASEMARVRSILEEERAILAEAELVARSSSWWRFWRRQP